MQHAYPQKKGYQQQLDAAADAKFDPGRFSFRQERKKTALGDSRSHWWGSVLVKNTGLGSRFFESLTARRTRSRLEDRPPNIILQQHFCTSKANFLWHSFDVNLLCFIHLCI